jgi:hypothetical protein
MDINNDIAAALFREAELAPKARPKTLPSTSVLLQRAEALAAHHASWVRHREGAPRETRLGPHSESGLSPSGLAPGWADARLPKHLEACILRVAKRSRAHRGGRSYQTQVNGVPVVVLPSGRVVMEESS